MRNIEYKICSEQYKFIIDNYFIALYKEHKREFIYWRLILARNNIITHKIKENLYIANTRTF